MEMGTICLYGGSPSNGSLQGPCGTPGLGVGPVPPPWLVYPAPLPKGLGFGSRVGSCSSARVGYLSSSLCLPQINQEAALEVPSPRTVYSCR